jgi:hypothetical protein
MAAAGETVTVTALATMYDPVYWAKQQDGHGGTLFSGTTTGGSTATFTMPDDDVYVSIDIEEL